MSANGKKDIPKRLALYILGLFLMTAGIAISVLSDLGVAPLSTIPYAATLCTGLDMGLGTIIMHAIFVLMQIALLRKKFRPVMLLQIPAGILFGWFTTLCNGLMSFVPKPDFIVVQVCFQLVSIILIAVGIHFYFPANIMPLAGEGIVSAISETFGWQFAKVKIGFDASAVALSGVICFIFLGNLGSVGIGTVMSAFLTGTCIAMINKLTAKIKKKSKI